MSKKKNTKHSQRVSKPGNMWGQNIRPSLSRFVKSIWFFPALLLIPFILFTAFQISGSSIGVYHNFFYGEAAKDKNLLLGEPRPIRGDEWNHGTQVAIAQSQLDYARINTNIGNGQDLSIIMDVPYKDWSIIFKPHNIAFLFMSFDNAFAFKWWLMLYLLVVSCYFFILALLPGKRLLASLLAVGFAFNPFIQWWYLYGTLGSLFYTLLAGVFFMAILNAKKRSTQILWGVALAYVLTCFILVLYPPFQIPCALAVAAFAIGYLIEKSSKHSFKSLIQPLIVTVGAVVVSGILALTFVMTREDIVKTVTNTAYPGARVVQSGGFDIAHLMSGQLSPQLQNPERASRYPIGGNQSEASNFVLLLPFLFLPGVYLLIRGYRKDNKLDWPLLTTSLLFVFFLIRMYVPHTDWAFKPLLTSIPLSRLLIGIGLLSLIYTVLVIRNLKNQKSYTPPQLMVIAYTFAVWLVCAFVSAYIYREYPGFIGLPKAFLLSLPIPIIVYLLLSKRFTLGALTLSAFIIFCGVGVNPLYRQAESSILNTPLSQAIRQVSAADKGKWVSESITYEQLPIVNGSHSLTGVYSYPQLDLWKDSGAQEDIYNRYAHVHLLPDRDVNKTVPSRLVLESPDTISINTEPCSDFLRKHDVRFILVDSPISDSCLSLERKVKYPLRTFYVYKINQYQP